MCSATAVESHTIAISPTILRGTLAAFGCVGGLGRLAVFSGAILIALHFSNMQLSFVLAASGLGSLLWTLAANRGFALQLGLRGSLGLLALVCALPVWCASFWAAAAVYLMQGILTRHTIGLLYTVASAIQRLSPTDAAGSRLLRIEAVCAASTAVIAGLAIALAEAGLPLRAAATFLAVGIGCCGLLTTAPLHLVKLESAPVGVRNFLGTRFGPVAIYAAEIAMTGYATSWTNVFGRAIGSNAGHVDRWLSIAGPAVGFWLTVAGVRFLAGSIASPNWRRNTAAGAISAGIAGTLLPWFGQTPAAIMFLYCVVGAGTALWVPFALYLTSRQSPVTAASVTATLAFAGPVISFAANVFIGYTDQSTHAAFVVVLCVLVSTLAGSVRPHVS